jgi:hypothetical protein
MCAFGIQKNICATLREHPRAGDVEVSEDLNRHAAISNQW